MTPISNIIYLEQSSWIIFISFYHNLNHPWVIQISDFISLCSHHCFSSGPVFGQCELVRERMRVKLFLPVSMYCVSHNLINTSIVRRVEDKNDEKDYCGLKAVEAFPWYFQFINMLMSWSSSCLPCVTYSDAWGCFATLLKIAPLL